MLPATIIKNIIAEIIRTIFLIFTLIIYKVIFYLNIDNNANF